MYGYIQVHTLFLCLATVLGFLYFSEIEKQHTRKQYTFATLWGEGCKSN